MASDTHQVKDLFTRLREEADILADRLEESAASLHEALHCPQPELVDYLLALGSCHGAANAAVTHGEALSRELPGPNQVPSSLQAEAALVGKALFTLTDAARREAAYARRLMALRLAAVVKEAA